MRLKTVNDQIKKQLIINNFIIVLHSLNTDQIFYVNYKTAYKQQINIDEQFPDDYHVVKKDKCTNII